LDLQEALRASRAQLSFSALAFQVEQVMYDNPTALQKLRTGELAALVRVIGKPIDFFAKIPANSGLHFVPIMDRCLPDHPTHLSVQGPTPYANARL